MCTILSHVVKQVWCIHVGNKGKFPPQCAKIQGVHSFEHAVVTKALIVATFKFLAEGCWEGDAIAVNDLLDRSYIFLLCHL